MSNIRTETINLLVDAYVDLAKKIGHPELGDELQIKIDRLNTKADGRANWSEERRQATAKRMAEYWAKKRVEAAETFYRYQFSDKPPTVLGSREELAAASGLALKTVTNKLCENADGFIMTEGRATIVYARNEDARDRLLQAPALATGDLERAIVLPSSKAKRF